MTNSTDHPMPIAIVGLAGRFPGDASNPQKLWSVLVNKKSTRTEVPPDRFNIDAFYHPSGERNGTTNTRWAHFMKRDLAAFDAPFFSILPNEARAMDVQSRMALECAYEALENAGIPIDGLAGTQTACYVASFTHDYAELMGHNAEAQPKYAFTGSGVAMMANRISWFLDIRGPSVTIDTACSSSLVAVHMACQSINSGEAEIALVGGANVILLPQMMANQSSLGFLSRDGRSKAFDQGADGYARGEGVSFLVLKHLDAAIRDGDTIRALIRGTGVNQDGRTPGITVPSSESQEQLIRTVYERAGLNPGDTPFVETHGTGTQKGDAAEASALAKTLGRSRSPQRPVYLGSVKTNLGHLEAAAGVTQVIKVILALENAIIPPNIWFEHPNPNIPLNQWHLKVPTEPLDWPSGEKRRASINSFGYGGTNAHCILETAEEYMKSIGTSTAIPQNRQTTAEVQNNIHEDQPLKLLLWSSHDKMGIRRMASQYAEYLDMRVNSDANNEDLVTLMCRTLHSRRSMMPWKSYMIAGSVNEMILSFREQTTPAVHSSKLPLLAFVFTGQGAQWPGMGRQLLHYPAFRDSLRLADKYLRAVGMDGSLIDELMVAPEQSKLHLPVVSQTLCTALQVALVDLLDDCGIKPAVVVGHSGGEIAAAYAKGAISREAAWTIGFHRGRLCSALTEIAPSLRGGMLVAGLSKKECTQYIKQLRTGNAVVACVNSPVSCTLAGDISAIEQLEEMLRSAGHFHRRLRVDRAYHSPHMQFIAEECLNAISHAHPLPDTDKNGSITMYSTVTGRPVESRGLLPSYWISNMVEPVEFVDAVDALLTDLQKSSSFVPTVLVEIGPHSALKGPLRQIMDAHSIAEKPVYTSLLIRNRDAHQTFLEAMGSLAQLGYPVDLHRVNQVSMEGPFLVDLPSYPWNHSEKNRYWAESRLSSKRRFRQHARHDLCGVRGEDDLPGEPTWHNILSPRENPWILDHRVQGSIVYPAAGMLTAVLEAVRQYVDAASTISHIELRDVRVTRPIVFNSPEDEVDTCLRLRRRAGDTDLFEFRYYSQRESEWQQNCSGVVRVGRHSPGLHSDFADETGKVDATFRSRYHDCHSRCVVEPVVDELYARLSSVGLQFGPWFQNLVRIAKGPSVATGCVQIPSTKACMPCEYEQDMLIHPVVLDGLVQLGLNTSMEAHDKPGATMVPVGFRRVVVSTLVPRSPGTQITGYSTLNHSVIGVDVAGSDANWKEPWVILEGLELATLSAKAGDEAVSPAAVPRKLAARLVWQADIRYSPKAIVQNACEVSAPSVDGGLSLESLLDLQRGALICIQRVLETCPLRDVPSSPPHLRQLHRAMTRLHKLALQGDLYGGDSSISGLLKGSRQSQDLFLQRFVKSSIDAEILYHHCRNLDGILRGKMHSIQVLREEDRLNRWYAEGATWRANHAKISAYLRLYAHKHPHAKILEVGGGTGGLTLSTLQALTLPDGSALFNSYCFTDISGAFFEKAQKKFERWAPLIKFTTLNIEKDIVSQGFKEGDYDLILADNVLHATESIHRTLSSIRKLLKPNGQLILSEITRNHPHITMTVGALEGWWLGVDDGREWEPTLSVEMWDKALRLTGFTGVDICLNDSDEDHHIMSGMVATAKEKPGEKSSVSCFVLIHPQKPTPDVEALIQKLLSNLQGQGIQVTAESLANIPRVDPSGKCCVLLLDSDPCQSDLANLSSIEWESLKHILLTCANATWITRGATLNGDNPWASMALGLVRSFRAEHPSSAVTIVDLASQTDIHSSSTVSSITKLAIAGRDTQVPCKSHDWEYCIRGHEVLIPRVIVDDAVNDGVFSHQRPIIDHIPFTHPDTSLALASIQPILFVDDSAHRSQPLKNDEVEIQVMASGLEEGHSLRVSGHKGEVDGVVNICGIVSALGPAADSTWQVGDPIMTFRRDTVRNFCRTRLALCQRIPNRLGDFRAAASFPFAYCTAFYCLFHKASLKAGESVLINCSHCRFDEAAINLALQKGVRVFLTVSSQARKHYLAKRYSLPEDHIFNGQSTHFVSALREITLNRGVDVIINRPAASQSIEMTRCLSPGGRLVLVQRRGEGLLDATLGVSWPQISESTSVHFVSHQALAHAETARVAKIFAQVTQLLQGSAQPWLNSNTTGPQCKSDDCLRVVSGSGEAAGDEMIVETSPNIQVPVLVKRPVARLLENFTYIISGGAGGLGTTLARWMWQRGARHIAILSRSPHGRPELCSLQKEMAFKGAHLAMFACDITDEKQVQAAMAQIRSEHPPVRGVIQAAMVLDDCVFQNMTFESWNRAVQPKATGSWILHKHTPKEVDFFILLSSIAGVVGLRGQANYAAGNTFQDALASYRRSRGQAAVALNVGFVDGVGFLSKGTARVGENIARFDSVRIQRGEFLRLVESAIIHSDKFPPQVITGCGTGGILQSNGDDLTDFYWFNDPRFQVLAQVDLQHVNEGEKGEQMAFSLPTLLSAAPTADAAAKVVQDAICRKLATASSIAIEEIDCSRHLSSYGVDSLLAVDLRSYFASEAQAEVSVFELTRDIPITELARDLALRSKHVRSDILDVVH
ncbi:hypothetical protein CFD26_104804 [Aspergillus turcosus]|uniref:Uncharacterized protein n=1 Tax=Aspergillus turcosus TaxID=1245748 RepID=A0A3R7J4W7_9EURO|nr:hypothetical protein CFD26_104804 [Aspergillus turcosus]